MTPEERLTAWVRKDEVKRSALVGSRYGEMFVRLTFPSGADGESQYQIGYGETLPSAIADALARSPE